VTRSDLRDRIAAALQQADRQTALAGTGLLSYSSLADAVIRELGLKIQVAGPDGIVGTGKWRYVTDFFEPEPHDTMSDAECDALGLPDRKAAMYRRASVENLHKEAIRMQDNE
jgi:hypothetical protein